MGTEEFQAETKKKAENLGKTWGNTVSGTAQGLEATLDDEAIGELANKGAITLGKGLKHSQQDLTKRRVRQLFLKTSPLPKLELQ